MSHVVGLTLLDEKFEEVSSYYLSHNMKMNDVIIVLFSK